MKLELEKFCLFVGYARSGSSAVGSIVDAHPNAIISHEYNVLSKAHYDRQKLFGTMIERAARLNNEGRWSGGANGEIYKHIIEGQIKKEDAVIQVIGDKKSGSATRRLQAPRRTPYPKRVERIKRIIDALEDKTGIPCMFVHVIRNPYDIIAAQKQSRIRFSFAGFRSSVKTMAITKELYPDRWLDVYHEDLISHPSEEIKKVNSFLGLSLDEVHLKASIKHLKFVPKQRRYDIDWSRQLKQKVKTRIIKEYEFFNRYSFKN